MLPQVVASWLTAIGSAGSLMGFAAYVWIMLLNRRDEAELRQERQAQGVSAWLDEGRRHDRDEDFVICVHNGGNAPVFACRVLIGLPSDEENHPIELAIVPPETTITRALPFNQQEVDPEEIYSAPAVPELRFTDPQGVAWQRDRNGRLSRLNYRGPRKRPGRKPEEEQHNNRAWRRQYRKRTEQASASEQSRASEEQSESAAASGRG